MSDQPVCDVDLKAGADLSSYQFCGMYISAANTVTYSETATNPNIGILQNKPAAAGRSAQVRCMGKSKGVSAGSVAAGDAVTVTTGGKLTTTTTEGDCILGYALTAGTTSGDIFDVLVIPQRIGT